MPYIGKSPTNGVRNRFQYTATAGQTTFSGADDNALTLTYSDTLYIDSSSDRLSQIVPNQSCERILQLWKSKWSGIYTIAPLWAARLKVYCDMKIDGWGWTLVARSSEDASLESFWWLESIWSPENMLNLYSLWAWVRDIFFDQVLMSSFIGAWDIDASWIVESVDSSVIADASTSSEVLLGSCNIITNTSLDEEPTCFTHWWETDRMDAYIFKKTASTWLFGLANDGYTSAPNFLNSMRNMQWMIFIR